jgi:pantetheine-phosphate adenylyltransferase
MVRTDIDELPNAAQELLELLGVRPRQQQQLVDAWNEPHRYYHTMEHLHTLVRLLETTYSTYPVNTVADMVARERFDKDNESVLLALIFHDIVYEIGAKDNEAKSVEYMREFLRPYIGPGGYDIDVDKAARLIMATADHNTSYVDPLERQIVELDLYPLRLKGGELVRYEQQIFREYQSAPIEQYVDGRCAFLRTMLVNPYLKANDFAGIEWLIGYVRSRPYRIGLYAGSFNPFHDGHMAILRAAEKTFDKVVVLVGVNPAKSYTDNTANTDALRAYLAGREVRLYGGMLHELLEAYALPNTTSTITLVRGIRNAEDLAHEQAQLAYMHELSVTENGINAVFIPCEPFFAHLSSSAIRQLLAFNEVAGRRFVRYGYQLPS